jgi:mutator protein MutT
VVVAQNSLRFFFCLGLVLLLLDMESAKVTPYVQVAIGIVVGADGRVLICRRAEGGSFAGYWEFPGGKCEVGEAPAEAVRRELREELNIGVTPVKALARIEHQYPKGRVVLYPFVCRHESGMPVALCASEFCWVEGERLGEYRFPEANSGLIEELKRGLASWAIDLGVGGT